jgi:DNA modification methylase
MIRDNPMADHEYRIIHADARKSGEPDKSVHVSISSPPYWGLRFYSTDPKTWGGDAACEHDWDEAAGYVGHRGNRGQVPQTKWKANTTYPQHEGVPQATCRKCGSWRGELGQEPTPEMFCEHLVEVYREVRRILRDDGSAWVNLGVTYAASTRGAGGQGKQQTNAGSVFEDRKAQVPPGYKAKDLIDIPAMFADAMRRDGWYYRCRAPWLKINAMPGSMRDRPHTATEYWMLFSKQARYYYDPESVREVTRYRRDADWWYESAGQLGAVIGTDGMPLAFDFPIGGFRGAHFATMPLEMVSPCVRLSTSDTGCCPRCGSPHVRVIKKDRKATRPAKESKVFGHEGAESGNRDPGRHITVVTTLGWKPSCDCPAGDPVPAIVHDPFNGASTTAIAAMELGRHYVGTEVNKQYIGISHQRVAEWRRVQKGLPPKPAVIPKGEGLFELAEDAA